jgi:gamma-glutamylcyclotransferase
VDRVSIETFKYFAYGSNMLTERLRAPSRCPSAEAIGVGVIFGYTLAFSKRSRDGSGKATMVRSGKSEEHVFGVVFDVAISERAALDKAEGVGSGYKRIDDLLVRLQQGGEILRAATYIATEADRTLHPYDWYRGLVIAGAMQHTLPDDWIAMLKQVASVPDRDPKRRLNAIAVLKKAGFGRLLNQ